MSPYLTAEISKGPDGLKGPLDSSGSPVGCKSDCGVDPNPSDSPSCCSGSHSTPQTCPNSGVPNYSYFSTLSRLRCIGLLCNTLFLQSRSAPIHTCTHMMSRAGLHFGLAPHRPMRITRLPSAPKLKILDRLCPSKVPSYFLFLSLSLCVYSGDTTSMDEY